MPNKRFKSFEFIGQFRLRFVSAPRPHFRVLSKICRIRFKLAALPNYAIKRDLRGNIRFIRIVIRRVGPLFWLLDPQEGSCVI